MITYKKNTPRPIKLLGSLALLATLPMQADAFVFDSAQCANETPHIPRGPNLMMFVDRSGSLRAPIGGTIQTTSSDPRTDGTRDNGLDVIAGNAPGNPTGRPGVSLSSRIEIPPYVWVANHDHNTVSKFNTNTFLEEGRYAVGISPSRTAVDLDGNAWVGSRGDGVLTKILWDKTQCPDKNNDGIIQTSNGTNLVSGDECIIYQQKPQPGYTIRGLAAGPDGRVWIGYTQGGVQAINAATFQLGPYHGQSNVPLWRRGADGVYTKSGTSGHAGGVYGLVLDAQGILYVSSTNRCHLPAFDTKTAQWVGSFVACDEDSNGSYSAYGSGQCSYGITVDANRNVWTGCWPGGSGVREFDATERKFYFYPHSNGKVTGLAVEAATGDVWASFFQVGRTGRLKYNKANRSASTWQFIPTCYASAAPNASRTQCSGNDLRGVGFDINGFAWTLGLGSTKVFKLDPATNFRAADLPNGAEVGVGTHYTYSDFTGAVAQSFTAPSGKWRRVYDTNGAQIASITVDAYVPTGTTVGVRYRRLDADGNPIGDWVPPEQGGVAQYAPTPVGGAQNVTFNVPTDNDNPFVAPKFEVEVRLTTSDKGVRPILHGVSFSYDNSQPKWTAAQDIARDLNNTANRPGGCTTSDGSGCDLLQVGIGYFDASYSQATAPGENTNITIDSSINMSSPGGLTNIGSIGSYIENMAELKDPNRDNFALLITDGRYNREDSTITAVRSICNARRRAASPVTTFVVGLGDNTDKHIMGLLAAAGTADRSSAWCCAGNTTSCATKIDPCALVDNNTLGNVLAETGAAPFTQVVMDNAQLSCTGSLNYNQITGLKNYLRTVSNEASCTFKLQIPDDPQQYNVPMYPQKGALADPGATRVVMNNKHWAQAIGMMSDLLVTLPYCPAGQMNCGLQQTLTALGVPNAASFANDGWFFLDPAERTTVRLTPNLCNEIAQRHVKNVRTQIACQCRKTGQSCEVPCSAELQAQGYACEDGKLVGRCRAGTYACAQDHTDQCVSIFTRMPETCNGLDDNCDGQIDDLQDSKNEDKGPDWSNNTLPSEYSGLTCGFQNTCSCRTVGTHKGDNLASYIQENWAQKCRCAEGVFESAEEATLAPTQEANADGTQGQPAATGCASTGIQATAPAMPLMLGLIGLVGLRRRRRSA
jgi:uncharacterized protein (TIGR03382 family)